MQRIPRGFSGGFAKHFDQAWHKIESDFVSDGDREAALMRLAGIILMLARDSISSLEELRDAAVRVFSLDL